MKYFLTVLLKRIIVINMIGIIIYYIVDVVRLKSMQVQIG